MKRALLLIALLFIFGCSASNKAVENEWDMLKKPFGAEILLCWNESEYQGSLKYGEDGAVALSLYGEKLVIPVCFEAGGESFSTRVGESMLKIPLGTALPDCVAEKIRRAFAALREGKPFQREGQAGITAQNFTLYIKDGVFTVLELPEGELIFKSFELANEG